MPDSEKVIKGLEDTAGYFRHLQSVGFFGDQPVFREHELHCNDALALLKEQEKQIKNRDESLEKAREEIKELITELAIEKQKQISNIKSELQVQTAILDTQYQNAMMQTQLSFR